MKTSRVLFHTARVLFGTGHLVFDTAAKACLLAEVESVKRTGFEVDVVEVDGSHSKQMMRFGESDSLTVDNYKKGRVHHTQEVQQKVKLKGEEAKLAFAEYRRQSRMRVGF